jgi:class 3 adenylate cyclase/pimeloyl-ACP methyl ester carboxylesterase
MGRRRKVALAPFRRIEPFAVTRSMIGDGAVSQASERAILPTGRGRPATMCPMEARIQYARTADGVSIAFWAAGDGYPVVEMPPVPWSHLQVEFEDEQFRRWYEDLSQRVRLVRYDNRGSGLSERGVSAYTPEEALRDLEAVVGRLGLERFALVGVSPSSPTAIEYAARNPDRVSHLILWCGFSACFAEFAVFEPLLAVARADWSLYTETAAHAMVAGWAHSAEARRFAALMREATTFEMYHAFYEGHRKVDVTPLLEQVRCPTLVVHRRQAAFPSVATARSLAAGIPNAHLMLLDGEGVLPFVGDTASIIRAFEGFLPAPQPAEAPRQVSSLSTILFTGIEGHTELISRLGDSKGRELLREHERITREALRAHGGAEVKSMGDGFMASFASPTRAIECAMALQRAFAAHSEGWPEAPLRVRIGLNSGEPIAEEDDLFGASVIAAARIAARASGGQVLVANVVRELVAGKGFLFSDTGEHVLKGFEEPVRVWELRWQ